MKRLDQQLAGLATMSPAHLRTEWQRLFRETALELSDDLLRRSIAYRLQERARGGLAPGIRRKLDRLAGRTDAGKARAEVLRPSLRPGARLIRDWHGKTHQVLVLDSGFLFEERHYSSLTHIARDITGSNWSGPRFFGLRAPKKGRVEADRG